MTALRVTIRLKTGVKQDGTPLALEDATGVRLTVLPLTPERVVLAIAQGPNGNGHA